MSEALERLEHHPMVEPEICEDRESIKIHGTGEGLPPIGKHWSQSALTEGNFSLVLPGRYEGV
jgi:hypothetical protein